MDEDPYFLFKQSRSLKIFFFIGRLNPPHPGHIHALEQMIETANAHNSVALILLGSGPKGERTLDNPVSFETKREFLQFALPGYLQYTVRKLTNPSGDVTQWYENVLSHIKYPSDVEFIRFAGDKGDNATKFGTFMDDRFRTLHERAKSTTVAIPPVMSATTEMSATTVRQGAYTAFVTGKDHERDGYPLFREQFFGFYREFCEQIYREIVEPAEDLTREQIIAYIQHKTLPKKGKTKSKSKTHKSNRANGGISNEDEPPSGKGKSKSKSKGRTKKNMENSD
jgi:nicotinamide mononucleotide adenylyltransferase